MSHVARINDLKAKLAARQGKPGYEENCEAIRAQIAVLEARQRHIDERAAPDE